MHRVTPVANPVFLVAALVSTLLCAYPAHANAEPVSGASPAEVEGATSGADAAAKILRSESKPAAGPVPKPENQSGKLRGEKNVEKVTVTAGRPADMEERRLSTASKLVYDREELDRDGDSTVGEILKRLPGVTLSGRPGRGGDIRMRGLGSGYTQILLNGDRPPRGFSLDTLSPDQVERIEIMRGPVAEYSTQAIAGTINIVLREDYKQTQTQIRLSKGLEQGRNTLYLSLTYPGEIGALSYSLSGSVYQRQQMDDVLTENLALDASGQATLDQRIANLNHRHSTGIHLSPRFSYRFENGDTLVFQPFVMQAHSATQGAGRLTETLGLAPYASAAATGHADTTLARGFGNWQHRLEGGGKLNIKFAMGLGNSDSHVLRNQYGAAGNLLDAWLDTNATRDHSASTGGKYSTPIGEGHTFALGWDAEWARRSQTRVSLDNGLPQFADSGDSLSAETRRTSGFVQDEWEIDKQWSAYFGLRWEGIRTASDAPDAPGGKLTNTSSVWSPVLHGVWRIPDSPRDQVRLSLTHSYRAPSLNDLVALPVLSHLNGPTSPDRIGNPKLKPELATGIDLAYEHYLSRSGILSANLFARSIADLMRREIGLQNGLQGPRWVSQAFNIGHATASSMELEAKFQLAEFFTNPPAVEFRGNYSRFWSRVDQLPGPNNRLEQQPRQTANMGLDYRLAAVPLTLGGNLNWTPAYVIQSSETQTASTGVKRQLDLYGLWKFDARTQLRISANNLLRNDYLSGSTVHTFDVNQISSVTARTYTTWSIRLELKV